MLPFGSTWLFVICCLAVSTLNRQTVRKLTVKLFSQTASLLQPFFLEAKDPGYMHFCAGGEGECGKKKMSNTRLRCVLFLDAKARMTKLSDDEFKTLGMNPRTARRAKKGHRHFVNVKENGEESFGKAMRLISCLLFGVQREQRSLPLRYEVHLEFCAPSDCSSLSD
jgi:hypothetical protein